MKQNKISNATPEQVVIFPKSRIIRINNAQAFRGYALFNSETGVQVNDFTKGTKGQVEFDNLEPSRHYDVGVIENIGDDKPQFSISWTHKMKDDTDSILNNSDNLPVVYPKIYSIINKDDKQAGVFDLTDDNNIPVGKVVNLSSKDDKPEFAYIYTFKMKDDEKE